MMKKSEIGEGNYKAGRNFNDKETAFVKNNPAKIKQGAKAARDALDSSENDEVENTEHQSMQPVMKARGSTRKL